LLPEIVSITADQAALITELARMRGCAQAALQALLAYRDNYLQVIQIDKKLSERAKRLRIQSLDACIDQVRRIESPKA
jgi:hypothetical protein